MQLFFNCTTNKKDYMIFFVQDVTFLYLCAFKE